MDCVACGSNAILYFNATTRHEEKSTREFKNKIVRTGREQKNKINKPWKWQVIGRHIWDTIRTVQWSNTMLVRHHHKRSMVVDKPINRRPMVQHIRIKRPWSSRFVGPNLSHTIYCPNVNWDFAVCHYLWAIYRALPIESIADQRTNEMLIYVPAPWHRPRSPCLVN